MTWTNVLDAPAFVTADVDGGAIDSGMFVKSDSSGSLPANMGVKLTFASDAPASVRVHAVLADGSSPYGYYVGTASVMKQSYATDHNINLGTDSGSGDVGPVDMANAYPYVIAGDGDGAHWGGGTVSLLIEVDYTPPAPPPESYLIKDTEYGFDPGQQGQEHLPSSHECTDIPPTRPPGSGNDPPPIQGGGSSNPPPPSTGGSSPDPAPPSCTTIFVPSQGAATGTAGPYCACSNGSVRRGAC